MRVNHLLFLCFVLILESCSTAIEKEQETHFEIIDSTQTGAAFVLDDETLDLKEGNIHFSATYVALTPDSLLDGIQVSNRVLGYSLLEFVDEDSTMQKLIQQAYYQLVAEAISDQLRNKEKMPVPSTFKSQLHFKEYMELLFDQLREDVDYATNQFLFDEVAQNDSSILSLKFRSNDMEEVCTCCGHIATLNFDLADQKVWQPTSELQQHIKNSILQQAKEDKIKYDENWHYENPLIHEGWIHPNFYFFEKGQLFAIYSPGIIDECAVGDFIYTIP